MLPSIDLTKIAFGLPSVATLRRPGVAIGGGALLGAGLGAGIGALTADTDHGESRWGRAGVGAALGGAAGAGAGLMAADTGEFNPYAKAKPSARPAPAESFPELPPLPSQRPVPSSIPVRPGAAAPPVVADDAFAVVHGGNRDIARMRSKNTDGTHTMESLITGETYNVHPDAARRAMSVDDANNALMTADHTHPLMQFLGGDNPAKFSSFWASEYFKLR